MQYFIGFVSQGSAKANNKCGEKIGQSFDRQ